MEKSVAYLWELMYFGVDIDFTLYFLRSARLGFVPPIMFHILQNTSWYCFALFQKNIASCCKLWLICINLHCKTSRCANWKKQCWWKFILEYFLAWFRNRIFAFCNTLNISTISFPIIVLLMKFFLEKHQRKTNWIVLSHLQNQRGDRVNYPLCFHLSNLLQKVLNG